MDIPETNYAKSGDIHIAYQVTGSGPPVVIWVPGFTSNVERVWEFPEAVRFITRFSSFCRLIRFDKRGTGLSDRAFGIASLEDRMDDVRAVIDAVGAQRVTLFGQSEGGPMSILFAATYPQRTEALVMYGAFASNPNSDKTVQDFSVVAALLSRDWGKGVLMTRVAPSKVNQEGFARTFASFERSTATPSAAIEVARMNRDVDVRHLLGAIHVPTLVLHRTNDVLIHLDKGRYIADHVPNAKFVELAGMDHYPFFGDGDSVLDEVEEFVTGSRSETEIDRVLATVLFTDIVDSTRRAAELGDSEWRGLLNRHDTTVRQQIARFRGHEVKNLGDGFLATFDGPARAVRCACAISDSVQPLGIAIRSGLHTGEIEMKRNDIGGIAVHIASRIARLADPGTALVSSTVRDLVAGSGLRFDDRGNRTLRGVPEPVRLFMATA